MNLWREWAKVEIAGEDGRYEARPPRDHCAGIVLTLARQEDPDLSSFSDPEVVMRIRKHHHAGLIVASNDCSRVSAILDDYAQRFTNEFQAFVPAPERPTE